MPDNRLITRPASPKRDKPVIPANSSVIRSVAVDIQHPEAVHIDSGLTGSPAGPITNQGYLPRIPAITVKLIAPRAHSVVRAIPVVIQYLEAAPVNTDLRLPVPIPIPVHRNIARCLRKCLIILIRRRIDPVAVIIQRPLTLVEVTHLGPLGAIPIPYHRHLTQAITAEAIERIYGRPIERSFGVNPETETQKKIHMKLNGRTYGSKTAAQETSEA